MYDDFTCSTERDEFINTHQTDKKLKYAEEHDALVPYQVMRKIKDLAAKNLSVISVEGASHGFPCFMVEQTVQIIEGFIQPIV